ncbi:hypothetical protein Avbf_18748 [Armadillidium vulgare]|nr:hypothetical protein Avbf_18748 [Armadillidium vulgare]
MRTEELGISYTRVCHPNFKSILQFALRDKKLSSNFSQTKIEEDLGLTLTRPEERIFQNGFPFFTCF